MTVIVGVVNMIGRWSPVLILFIPPIIAGVVLGLLAVLTYEIGNTQGKAER